MTPEKGKRRMRGVFDAEGPLSPALLAFVPYDDRYSHIVNRCGRRLATNFLFNGSTSSIWYGEWLRGHFTFRDTYAYRVPTNPGVPGSYECAACDGISLVRTAGILESSVGSKVDRGSEEGHGHGFM